jgi:hypothetical protein
MIKINYILIVLFLKLNKLEKNIIKNILKWKVKLVNLIAKIHHHYYPKTRCLNRKAVRNYFKLSQHKNHKLFHKKIRRILMNGLREAGKM